MRRRAPLREPDVLTSCKQDGQAKNFHQGSRMLIPRTADRLDLDFLAFLARHSVGIHDYRGYIEKAFYRLGRHPAEQEEEIDLLPI